MAARSACPAPSRSPSMRICRGGWDPGCGSIASWLGTPPPALRLGRQRIDKASDRGFRYDLVLGTIRHQQWRIEQRSGSERCIHQVDKAIDRVDPGLVDYQRIMR